MKYRKKPKYKLDKTKIHIPKKEDVSGQEIYRQMLMDKMRKRKKR